MKKVLVIDDTVQTTDLVKVMLNASGFECIVANSGKEGLALIKNGGFDIVLLDLAMPEVTGIDILTKMKEERILNRHKIILFTASPIYSDSEVEKLKDEFLVRDRIRKPFSRRDLVEVITKNLGTTPA